MTQLSLLILATVIGLDIKFASAGNGVFSLSTVVGQFGEIGNKNGVGTESLFNTPYGLTYRTDALYVADTYNNVIRKISVPDYAVTTFAGRGDAAFANGFGTYAAFYSPFDIVYSDKNKHFYVADNDNNMIRRISGAGSVFTFAGHENQGFTNGVGTKATFNWPWALTCSDLGLVYVADTYNFAIRRITANGVVDTLAGSGKSGTES